MSSDSYKDNLELEVENLGPILRGKIDLRPLTVFVGPSNTGKSYFAILIYALHKFFGRNDLSGRMYSRMPNQIFWNKVENQPQQLRSAFLSWTDEAFQNRGEAGLLLDLDTETWDKQLISIPESATTLLELMYESLAEPLVAEIRRCFGAEVEQLIRKGSKSGLQVNINIERKNSTEFGNIGHKLKCTPRTTRLDSKFPKKFEIRPDRGKSWYSSFRELDYYLRASSRKEGKENWFHLERLLGLFADLAKPNIVGDLSFPAFYLPADRTGVMHAHTVVVSALIESAAMTGLRPAARTPMLSGVLADFLEQLIELDNRPVRKGRISAKRAELMEREILRGVVRVEKSETSGYPRFRYLPEGWEISLPLMNASSMVSELAPVVLYLRHIVGRDNLLIVEEPESHLHPAMQVKFIRELAMLVRSGIRVVVTTHSEWVLEELSNIVRRSKIPKSKLQHTAHSEVSLSPDEVGAWFFRPRKRPKGSVVEEIYLDDHGLYSSGFDEVATELHNDWADISSSLGDKEG